MVVYRRSRRHRFLLFVLVLASVTAITLEFRGADGGTLGSIRRGVQDALAPVQSAASRVFEPVGDFVGGVFSGVVDAGDLRRENERLRQELADARGDQISAEGAERERQALLEILRLDWTNDSPAVVARVVTSAPTNFFQTVLIDRGRADGVEVGMPVVTGAGLAGKVLEATDRRATVLLLTDRSFNVGVRLTTSGAVGVAAGQGTGEALSVDFIEPGTPVAVDEALVTSGLQSSAFPPEVPVGRVKQVSEEPTALQQTITLEPAVDFGRLEFVRVLLWKPAG